MIEYKAADADGIAEITIDGRVTDEDIEKVLPLVEADVERLGKIRVLEIVRGFSGMTLGAVWKDLEGMKLIRSISHVALVADAAWMRVAGELGGVFFPGKVKTFEPETEAAARLWLKSAP